MGPQFGKPGAARFFFFPMAGRLTRRLTSNRHRAANRSPGGSGPDRQRGELVSSAPLATSTAGASTRGLDR